MDREEGEGWIPICILTGQTPFEIVNALSDKVT